MVKVIDPGHAYELPNVVGESTQSLLFIKKELQGDPLAELVVVQNGTTTEAVLEAVQNRLKTLQGTLPDAYTKSATYFVGQALHALQERTADRRVRGVEGTRAA